MVQAMFAPEGEINSDSLVSGLSGKLSGVGQISETIEIVQQFLLNYPKLFGKTNPNISKKDFKISNIRKSKNQRLWSRN